MNLRASVSLIPLLLLGAVAGSLQAAGAASEPGNALGDDDRLLKTITLRRPDTTLRSLLEEIGKTTGTKLTPPKELAEQKFTLFFKERPAARVMAVLAEYLDRKWARKGDGYELFADRAALAREAEHAGLPLAAQMKDLSEEISLSRLPAAEIEPAYHAQRYPKRTAPFTVRERGPWLRRLNMLEGLRGERYYSPRSMLLRTLTPSHLARLKANGVLRLSSRDGSLPRQVVSAMIEALTRGRPQPALTTPVGEAVLSIDTEAQEGYATGSPPPPRLRMAASLFFVRDGRRVGGGQLLSSSTPGFTPSLPLLPATADATLERPVDPPQPAWTSRFAGLSPAHKIHAEYMERAWRDEPPLSLLLESLHDRTALDVCSDSFTRVRLPGEAKYDGPPGTSPPVKPPNWRPRLGDYLQELTQRLHYSWTLRDSCLQFRSDYYYLDRAREVPPNEAKRLRAELEKEPDRQLDVLARAALRLTPDQTRGFADHWPWYLEGSRLWIPPPVANPRPWSAYAGILALFGSLGSGARARVRSGEPTPIPRSPVALERLEAQIAERSRRVLTQPAHNLSRALLSAETYEEQYRTYEYRESNGQRSIRSDSGATAPKVDEDAAGDSIRTLAPPLPVSRVDLDLRIPSNPNPIRVAHGIFLFLTPLPRDSAPKSSGPRRPSTGGR